MKVSLISPARKRKSIILVIFIGVEQLRRQLRNRENDDTSRFNPSAPLPVAPPGSVDPTNPLYAMPYAAYAAPQASSPLRQTTSLLKALLRQKLIWALIALMLFTFVDGAE